MRTHKPTLDQLIREAEEVRLQEVAVVSRGEEVLDHARSVAQTITARVRQVTTPGQPRPDTYPEHAQECHAGSS